MIVTDTSPVLAIRMPQKDASLLEKADTMCLVLPQAEYSRQSTETPAAARKLRSRPERCRSGAPSPDAQASTLTEHEVLTNFEQRSPAVGEAQMHKTVRAYIGSNGEISRTVC
ncbi:hypothetical protein NLM16_05960 [Bradyrhizobium brasilense]|uniref:hypothetical protein n=1 Tax=Bradyrhizobium brasilense TaxID=1419277 RepID=UPI0028776F7E|nr:hypothetical protein [Bradyrhizobium brasilense]MCP3413639.1 hypothetical protein [Bradyrhizobium brasilense]